MTTPIFTRVLTSDEYGQVSVFLSWQQLLGIAAMFNLSGGVFNNGMVDFPKQRDEYSYSLLVLSNIITLACFGIVMVLYPIIGRWIKLDRPLIVLMFSVFLVQPAYLFWYSRQRYELKYKATLFWVAIIAVISPAFAIISIQRFQESRVYARLFGAEVPLLFVYCGFYFYLRIKAHGKIETRFWKEAFLFNLPLLPHYLSSNILHNSDRVMISHLAGETATAYYSVAYSVASVVSIVWSAVNGSLLPYTYEHCKIKDYASISKVTQPLLTAFAGVCVLLIMLAPEVVAVMATADYQQAIYVIPPVVAGIFFLVQYYVYGNIVYYYKKPKYVMYASVLSAIANVFLNWLFIPRFGFIAAGYTTLVCYLLQAAIDYFAMKKVVGERVYNMRYLGVLSACVILVVPVAEFLYGYVVIRYLLVAGLLAVGFRYRKQIVSMLTIPGKKGHEAEL